MNDQPTSAKPITVLGVTFRCYHAGVLRYKWRSEDGRLEAARRSGARTYYAIVDGKMVPKRFRTYENAMRGAVVRMPTAAEEKS